MVKNTRFWTHGQEDENVTPEDVVDQNLVFFTIIYTPIEKLEKLQILF